MSERPTTDGTPTLRSGRWFEGDDEVALENRAALRRLDLVVHPGQPVIGISNTVSDLNPCNSSMSGQIAAAREAVVDAGGVPVVFPTISLGEDLMKPTAMLYRNLLAIEIEEMVRSYPLDALVLTGNCDKTIPGALMGAVSANIPTVMMIGGSRPSPLYRGRRLAAGTDLWKAYDEHRSGRMSDEEWATFETCYSCGLGACNVMGTATTMAIVAEALGFAVSRSATIPAGDPRALEAAAAAGRTAVHRALDPIRPRELVTGASLTNALKLVAASGGSTNALLHLSALAGRVGIRLSYETMREALRGVRVLADIQPTGSGLAEDFDSAGGVPALMRSVAGILDTSVPNIEGGTIASVLIGAKASARVIRALDDAVSDVQGISLVRGTLAPDGAVIKTSAASPRLLVHRGPAVVFKDYDDMRARIDDPELVVSEQSVLVLQNGGPIGGPGMPEWGMVPIPAKLSAQGVTDMVRVSDARMSGTSFGTVILHVAPESAVGGPLALVRDGDTIVVDVPAGRLDLEVEPSTLESRRSEQHAVSSPWIRGWVALYQAHVTQAPEGCDFDFLQAFIPGSENFIESTVGRS